MLQPPEPHSPLLGSDVLPSIRGCSIGLHHVQQVFATAGPLLGRSVLRPACSLVLLSVVREDDLYLDVQPKCLGGCFVPCGLLFCHSLGVKQVSEGKF